MTMNSSKVGTVPYLSFVEQSLAHMGYSSCWVEQAAGQQTGHLIWLYYLQFILVQNQAFRLRNISKATKLINDGASVNMVCALNHNTELFKIHISF